MEEHLDTAHELPGPDEIARHAEGLSALAHRLLGDRAAAEDVAQEAWLAALEGPRPADVPLRWWLRGVVRHLAYRLIRTESRRRRRERAAARPVADDAAPGRTARRAEAHRRLLAALLSLEEPYRETLLLRYLEGRTPAEIAARTGTPDATVRVRLLRGRARLRGVLDRDGDDRPWPLALLPLVRLPRAASLPGAALLTGGLAVKSVTKVAVLAAVLLLGLAGWLATRTRPEPRPPVEDHGAPVAPRPAADSDAAEDVVAPEPDRATTAAARVSIVDWSGAAIARARVEIVEAKPQYTNPFDPPAAAAEAIRSGTTGEGGAVRFRGLAPQRRHEAVAGAPGRARAVAAFHTGPAGSTADLTIRLVAGHTLVGRVLSPDGEPVRGAVVEIGDGRHFRASSDEAGAYRIDALPGGPHSVAAGRAGARPMPVAVVRLPMAGSFDIVLAPLATLTGTVRDADSGRPIPGARVRAGIWFGYRAHGEAVSNARGEYVIDTLPGEVVNWIDVRCDGYRGRTYGHGARGFQLPLRAGETSRHDVRLSRAPAGRAEPADRPERPRAAAVCGRVLDEDGAPVAGARVGFCVTGADGEFRIENLRGYGEPATWRFAVDGFLTYELTLTVPGPGEEIVRDVRLERAPVVRGRVTVDDGRAVPEGTTAEVHVVTGRRAPGPGGRAEVISTGGVAVAPDGLYETSVPWVASGEFRVDIRAPGLPPASSAALRCEPGRTVYAVDVVLFAGAELAGTVLDEETGAPIPAARLSAGSPSVVLAVTGPTGAFRVEGAPVGTIGPEGKSGRWSSISVTAPGYLPRSESIAVPRDGPFLFRLQRSRRISGTVSFEDGAPAPGVKVMIDPHRIRSISDADGRFELTGVGPGVHRLLYEGATPTSDVRSGAVDGVAAGATDVGIVVRPGGEITGAVLDSEGAPVADAAVSAAPAGARSPVFRASTDGRGRFRIGGLPDGRFDLLVLPPEDGPYSDAARTHLSARRPDVAADTKDVEIVLPRGLTIAGRLTDEGGRPIDGVWLAVAGRTCVTDEGGRFRFDAVPEGEHAIRLDRTSAATGLTEVLGGDRVQAGATDVRLTGRHGESQEGRLVADDGPVAGVLVEAVTEGGRRRRATSGADGGFVLPNLPRGEVEIRVDAPGWVPVSERRTVPASGPVVVTLDRGLSASGVVRDAGGHPLAGIWIELTRPDAPGLGREARTDDDGRFSVRGLVEGEYRVHAKVRREGKPVAVPVGTLRAGDRDVALEE